MPLPEAFLEELKQNNDIASVFSSYTDLKRKGRIMMCACPFHSEKTPSCAVYTDTQSFYCFGCGAGGDVITFIMKIENLEYIEAVKLLAERSGMSMPENSFDDRTALQKAKIFEINRESARFFHACLMSPAGKQALEYFRMRGLDDEIIKKYGLGCAPNSWDALKNHLRKKGYTDDDLISAKVAARTQKGNIIDFFRNRAMFPVIDLRGNVIAFGGRRLNEEDNPKYINTSDTLVFKKSSNLFSLNFAKKEKAKTLILAEGYMDVISIYKAGFRNVVATLGTALTKEQARLMSQYADEVIIAYDSDGPGQTATRRAAAILDEVGLKIRIIKMTGAKDPDEFIKKYGATRFKLLLENSDSATNFELEKAKSGLDISTEEGRIEYSKRAVSILAPLKNIVERDVYASKVALALGISKEILISQINSERKNTERKKKHEEVSNLIKSARYTKDEINPDAVKHPTEARAEEAIIAFIFRNPDSFSEICEKITPEDFVTSFNRRVFFAVSEIIQSGGSLSLSLLNGRFSPDEMGRISGMLAKYKDMGNSMQLAEDYINTIFSQKIKVTADDAADLSNDELLALQNRLKDIKKP